jgi:formylmethanofuran dehydrogenase subunit E
MILSMSYIMRIDKKHIEKRNNDLAKAVEFHGHLCLGQILGVIMAESGLKAIGTTDPKKIIIYVENDRCIADAIQILTGTRFGRRSMKLVNYGKMAATFINTETGDAYRVWVSGKIKEIMGTENIEKYKDKNQFEKLLEVPSEEIVSIQNVIVKIPKEEMPGKPLRTVFCVNCKEKIFDGKELPSEKGPLCKACAEKPYYIV